MSALDEIKQMSDSGTTHSNAFNTFVDDANSLVEDIYSVSDGIHDMKTVSVP